MSLNPEDYYARREAQERARAESASDPAVRHIHLDLARRYAERVQTPNDVPQLMRA